MPRGVACNSGSSGLHLAMMMAGIGEGNEVLVPTLTFIAAVNPVRYAHAQPIFIGCDDSLCISPSLVGEFLQANAKMEDGRCINKITGAWIKAIAVVHVFGNLADMPALMKLAKAWNLVVIEDSTEALGSYYTQGEYAGKYAGTIGDVGVYSFNGNKIITGSSGGMLLTDSEEAANKARKWSTQARENAPWYQHEEIGYNYRMSNVIAGVVRGQYKYLDEHIKQKKTSIRWGKKYLE